MNMGKETIITKGCKLLLDEIIIIIIIMYSVPMGVCARQKRHPVCTHKAQNDCIPDALKLMSFLFQLKYEHGC
jgi:hypothetical protein